MFFDTLTQTVANLSTQLYSSVDNSIAAMCGYTWSSILPYAVGITMGLGIMKMLFEDDLVTGVRKLFRVMMPLFIVVWLVKPGGADGCRVVGVKNDILAMRAKITSIVAPDFSGGPAAIMTNAVSRMQAVNQEFLDKTLTAMSENQTTEAAK